MRTAELMDLMKLSEIEAHGIEFWLECVERRGNLLAMREPPDVDCSRRVALESPGFHYCRANDLITDHGPELCGDATYALTARGTEALSFIRQRI